MADLKRKWFKTLKSFIRNKLHKFQMDSNDAYIVWYIQINKKWLYLVQNSLDTTENRHANNLFLFPLKQQTKQIIGS
jgi:hypothetical protein